jgi:hypothetical protein
MVKPMDVRTIEAERFVLVDAQKRPRIVLEMIDGSSPRIGILDEQGKLAARLGESNGKPLLQFQFAGKLRASITVAPDGSTALIIGNEGPSVTVATMAAMQDEPTIILRSGSGAAMVISAADHGPEPKA